MRSITKLTARLWRPCRPCDHLPWKEASAEVGNAVHFASVYHKEWLWDGVRGEDNRVQIAPERS